MDTISIRLFSPLVQNVGIFHICYHYRVFENGKYMLQQYREEKEQSTKAKLHEEEQELNEAEIRERKC